MNRQIYEFESPSHRHQNSTYPDSEHDPYRKRKAVPVHSTPSDRDPLDGAHSRQGSDSSTSGLATNAANVALRPNYSDYDTNNTNTITKNINKGPNKSTNANTRINININTISTDIDPYCPSRGLKEKKRLLPTQRANSYLPYSRHNRDPCQQPAPIYIEDNPPCFPIPDKEGGVVSMLQDDLCILDIRAQQAALNQQQQQDKENEKDGQDPLQKLNHLHPTSSTLENLLLSRKRRKFWKKRRTLAGLVVFLIAVGVTWYFVWPRFPTVALIGADVTNKTDWTTNSTLSMKTSWRLNMTADNSANWIHTRFTNIAVTLTDVNTLEQFGQGGSGPLILSGRKKQPISIPLNIFYSTNMAGNRTFQDLYNACGVQVRNPVPAEQQETLQVVFHITYSIVGIAWTKTDTIQPVNGFSCPTD
ncbi:hypothetical protein J3Q64DRAFT_1770304 [Phycomyces blakesleeanus]|uniref:Uncharacterized protein n=2 Tax=Phycomyces blakesleeanus TaxID=4837 RepID=A0A162TP67_PHYB8|nr:hypothetical protein PHYBLDRAFT_149140 [Phycomyces blakesleeanus NRRL 1555(-)]OAD69972.1 hypothetical protein PHYBLDRAFT_149140 [Phycomyces blakesleeanus NRRL 1555(-)]|eukprot:XP_018288012.1 hypothetical protein PHYBLDRAFT_149140 [Phycomyces blakesleeanus NRRL 1555(-)]